VNDWISVKDKLPELYVDVRVRTEYGTYSGFRFGFGDRDWITMIDGDSEKAKVDVTHWRPLQDQAIQI